MMNRGADQQARLAAMWEQLASIAAQPQMLWLSTAGDIGTCGDRPGACTDAAEGHRGRPGACKDAAEGCRDRPGACRDAAEGCRDRPGACTDAAVGCGERSGACKDAAEGRRDRPGACTDAAEGCGDRPGACRDAAEGCRGGPERWQRAREHCSKGELLSTATAAREQQSEWELLSTAAERPREKQVAAREQQSKRELLSTAEVREQRSERELLSMVAKGPREKQVAAREQLSEGELLDSVAWETNVSGLQKTFEARELQSEWELLDQAAQETNVSGLQKMSMTRGAWETNMPERETAVTRRDEELLTSAAQKGRQSVTAAEQQRTAVVAVLVAAEPVAVIGTLHASQVIEKERWRCVVMHRRLPPPQGLPTVWQDRPEGQGGAGGSSQAVCGLPDTRSQPVGQKVPLQRGESRCLQGAGMQGQPSPSSAQKQWLLCAEWGCKVRTCRSPCHVLRELPPAARLDLVREHDLCKLCLGCCEGKAKRKKCRWRNRIHMELCQENKCRRRHHWLLQVERAQVEARQREQPPVERNTAVLV
jgi:hypothetical protein